MGPQGCRTPQHRLPDHGMTASGARTRAWAPLWRHRDPPGTDPCAAQPSMVGTDAFPLLAPSPR